MDPKLIKQLEEASSKLTETENILAETQKQVDELTTLPIEQLTDLVQKCKDVRQKFENQRLKIFTTLVDITLLLPTTRFSGLLETSATSDSICIEPASELKIKVWKVIPYTERFMTPEDFVQNYPSLSFSRSLIYQIREAISNLKKTSSHIETLQQVARLYQKLATELAIV